MELRMYLEVLRRRWFLVAAITLIVAATAGITSGVKTPVYRATAQVLLRPGDPAEELDGRSGNRLGFDANRYLAGQIDIVQSRNVAEAAARELHTADAGALLAGLSARQAGTTDIVAISFTDPDPVRASQAANAFAHAYIENRRAGSVEGLERASREVEAKLVEVQGRLADLDRRIAALMPPTTTTTRPPTPPAAQPPPAVTQQSLAATQPSPAATQQSPAGAPEPAPDALAPRKRTTTTARSFALISATREGTLFGQELVASHPDRSVFGQVADPRTPGPGQPVGPGPDVSRSNSDNPEALKAARDAAAVQYEALYSRQQELLITMSLKRGEAELIAAAQVPGTQSSPKPTRDLALGAVVGLMLGLGFAFLREQLDDRLRSREEVEEATGLPVLGELPIDADAAKHPAQVAAHERPAGALAEATRGLRTSLGFQGVDEPIRRLLVTSPGKGDGKSFVAANLAAAYAQAGLRTVLVSADLRRPRVDSLFPGIEAGAGLTEAIAGFPPDRPTTNGNAGGGDDALAGALAGALRPTRIDGLFFLPSGKLPPNPAELLGSRRAAALFEALSGIADVTVIDSPPLLAVTDAAVIAAHADGALLVASPGRTHRGALVRTAATLSGGGVRVVGVVLNRVEGRRGPYGYSYSYYYRDYAAAGDQPDASATPGRHSPLPWRRRNGAKAEQETRSGVGSQ